MREIKLTALILLLMIPASLQAFEVKSPDGRLAVTFEVRPAGDTPGALFWSVSRDNKPILVPSRLGLELLDAPPLDRGFRPIAISPKSHDSTWRPVYGERSEIRDHYEQAIVDLEDGQKPPRLLRLTFRAYDEGVAMRYSIPAQPGFENFTIRSENTEFRFAGDYPAWAVYSAQGEYAQTPLSQIKANCERPMPVEIPDGPTVAVGEARLVDYARMRLRPAAAPGAPGVASMLGGAVQASAPFDTPWRFVLVGDTPGQLIERNYLLENLNDPCAIADTSWIRPGKVIREVTLTTDGGKACVDFAVEHGLQYIEFDAGWYGNEYDDAQDATTVTVDPKRSKGPLALREVIDYAAQRGVGVLVYVNRRHLEKQLDDILPLYKSWGIKGVKYGFVNVGDQKWTTWLHEAVRKAAKYELMVDIHDEYRPTGYSRTYPNLMTQEGIRGNECMPPPEHNLILPFTRGLCGAGDYTICWHSDRIKTTHAHQLAASVVFYSPFQFVFWYDRPDMFKDDDPAVDFFRELPVVWDETRVLQGEIGKYITLARRSGDVWYVVTMNAESRREMETKLDFLKPGVLYEARVHSDGDTWGYSPREVSIKTLDVDSNSTIPTIMANNGGQAIRIAPKK